MEELLPKLLEQSALVITVFIGAYLMFKDRNRFLEQAEKERRAAKKELKDLNDKHTQELKELNALVRQHEKEHLQAIDALTDALEKLT